MITHSHHYTHYRSSLIVTSATLLKNQYRYCYKNRSSCTRSFFNSSYSSSSGSSGSGSGGSGGYSSQPNGFSITTNDLDSVFKFNIAVSYQPKDREPADKGTLYQQIQKMNDLDPQRQQQALGSPTGEDNYVVGMNQQLKSILLGVADGVGGWSELGFDSSAISRELCGSLQRNFESKKNNSNVDLIALLQKSYDQVLKEGKVKVGGTTVCFGVISSTGELKVSNLGDSWFGVFRRGGDLANDPYKCIHQSKDQTHGFNTPYQLAIIPKDLQEESIRQGKRYLQDNPYQADIYPSFQLQKDDIVLFATDGVTDNVCPEDIAIYLTDELSAGQSQGQGAALVDVSNKFVGKVNKLSQDHNYPSVFAQNLSKLIHQKYNGGKYDDITVVMMHVE